jgi:sugar transferase (PEP-CTERM/EpsH1 system associated)
MRILMITDRPPFPVISGATLRVYNLLQRIAKEQEVWFAALLATREQADGVAHLRDICQGVEITNIKPGRALTRPLEGLRYLMTGKPPDLRLQLSNELAEKIRQLVRRIQFDIVHIEFTHMGLYLELLPCELRERSVWMLHDIDWVKFARLSHLEPRAARTARLWLHSQMMRRWKPRFAERFSRCITVSENDRRLLTAANPRLQVDVVPNGVDTQMYQPLKQERKIPAVVFVGSLDYFPCVDAVIFFCNEVLPHIRRRVSNVEVWIVGSNPRPEVEELQQNGIHVTGRVDDVRPYYSRSTVCVVPLRAGGGTRLKILEAMALGRPVVSTSIGCEGLDVIDGEHLFIADHPEDFAEKTVRLLTDEPLRQSIINRARELVVSRYDWDIIANQLMQVYVEVTR